MVCKFTTFHVYTFSRSIQFTAWRHAAYEMCLPFHLLELFLNNDTFSVYLIILLLKVFRLNSDGRLIIIIFVCLVIVHYPKIHAQTESMLVIEVAGMLLYYRGKIYSKHWSLQTMQSYKGCGLS